MENNRENRRIILWHNHTIEQLEDVRDNDKLNNEDIKCINGTINILKNRLQKIQESH